MDTYVCGHLKPGSDSYTASKYATLCHLPRGHSGNHQRGDESWLAEQYACGHVRPDRLGALPIICELPDRHAGEHKHYGGFHWTNAA